MRSFSYLSITVAFLAGVCGGLLPRVFDMATASAASPETVRGARFELVDSAGSVRAVLESLGSGGARLRFFDEEMKSPLELRSGAGGLSAIVLRGRDGKMRAALQTSGFDKPALVMGDKNWEGRVFLGAVPSDDGSPDSDAWALLLGNPASQDLYAGLAMNTTAKPGIGSLILRSGDGRRWEAPLQEAVK